MHAEIVYLLLFKAVRFFIYSILQNKDVSNFIRSIHLIFILWYIQKTNPLLYSVSHEQIKNMLNFPVSSKAHTASG